MTDDSETRVTDILVEKNISWDVIREIMRYSFDINDGDILIEWNRREPYETDVSNITCLCILNKLSGDVSLMITVYRYKISNDLALKNIIRGFMKFRVASYFMKDDFDDFYHVDETGDIDIVRQVWDDDDESGSYYFEALSSYDGSLGEGFLDSIT